MRFQDPQVAPKRPQSPPNRYFLSQLPFTVGFVWNRTAHWPLPKFLEILLVICMPLQIRISRNFRGNMQVPAETLQNAEAETPGILPAVASQLASARRRRENFAPKQPYFVKIFDFSRAT